MNATPVIRGLGLPVRNIFCIGRNYSEHAKELGNEAPKEPVVFLKPVSSIIWSGSDIELPSVSQRVDHEVEIVVAIGAPARRVAEDEALRFVAGYGIGIDVTARDLQDKAKQKSLPWTVAKGFDTFAVLSEFARADQVGNPERFEFRLLVNDQERQSGRAADMLFSVPRLISWLSGVFSLGPGDLIFTGTPAGVAPLHEGDRLEAFLETMVEDIAGIRLIRLEAGVRSQ